jgi:peptidoglycan/xylan/chitin deacetylase (PgdA/CDA1 family)
MQVPATFFLIGSHVERDACGFVARALAEGHGIGHHAACPRQQAAPRPLSLHWFRPAGGRFPPAMLRTLGAEGYQLVLGSIFLWHTVRPPLALLRRFVLANAHPGGILLLHDRPVTIDATLATLCAVVPELRRRGYAFVRLESLLGQGR